MRILLLNCAYDSNLTTPADLLNRYTTLTHWSRTLLAEGASTVTVLQVFGSDASVEREGVEYFFRKISATDWPRQLRRLILERNPDLVHVNGLMFPWQTWWLRRVSPTPTAIVLQDHGGAAKPSRNPIQRIRQRMGLNVADAFLFTAVELANPWRTARLITPRQAVYAVMESSTTMRPPPREQAQRISGVRGSPALLWVGRLNANKDPLTILEGLERVLPDSPDAHLTMLYSSEELLPEVQTRIARSALLTAHVHLRGHVPNDQLAAFYRAADLFVLGSHHEGSGYALIEALACGTTPIVTSIPSFRALTGDGAIGALFPAGNAACFASALLRYRQRDLASLRAGILDHFERELSWPVIARRALAIYAEIAAHRTRP